MRVRTYEEILKSKDDVIFIDLRTKKEHELETIPSSINIPIFSDEQRAIIGTIYKQDSPKQATKQAIEFISERLPDIFKQINEVDGLKKQMVFFCARGGMRSSSIVGLLTGLKYNCVKLDFGYKGYRAFINEQLPKELEKVNFITLYGKTGTGKTALLDEIKDQGHDILDLEKCANHRGSILGQIGLNKQNSQKMFESLIYETLINRKSDLLFTEGESRRIGNIVMRDFIFDKIVGQKKVLIESPLEFRVDVIKKDYITENFDNADLIKGLEKLRRYISNDKIDTLIEQTNKGEYTEIINELMVNYYDLNYKCYSHEFEKTYYNDNIKKCAKEIINDFK